MKPSIYLTKGVALAALAMGLSLVQFEAKAFTHFEYSNLATTQILFTGLGGSADMAFDVDGSGVNFKVTETAPPGLGSVGFVGLLEGTFTVGAGATLAPITSVGGKLTLYDGAVPGPNYISGDLEWVELFNTDLGFVSTGALGMNGNLSNVTVTGAVANPELLAFAAAASGSQSAFLTYLLTPGKSLDDLRTLGADNHTAYAGVLSIAIPEASDAGAVAGAAILGLGIYAQIRRRRSAAPAA